MENTKSPWFKTHTVVCVSFLSSSPIPSSLSFFSCNHKIFFLVLGASFRICLAGFGAKKMQYEVVERACVASPLTRALEAITPIPGNIV